MGHVHLRGIEQQTAFPAWLDTADQIKSGIVVPLVAKNMKK
jgi:hypothetical protein